MRCIFSTAVKQPLAIGRSWPKPEILPAAVRPRMTRGYESAWGRPRANPVLKSDEVAGCIRPGAVDHRCPLSGQSTELPSQKQRVSATCLTQTAKRVLRGRPFNARVS